MAGNIKGITIEFNGDTTRLDKALREINNNTRSLDKELKQVNNALKFNPTSVELWRQKQDLLTQKVAETKTKLDTLKQAQAKMDAEGVDKNSEEYRKLQREIIVTENQVKNFEGQLKKVGNVNLRAASEQVKEMGNKLTSAGEAMKGISTAAAGVVASLGAVAYKAGTAADDLNTMSKVTGIGTQDLQKYSYAADLVDVSTETLAKSQTRLKKSMFSARDGGATAEVFEELGISVTDANGNLRDSGEVFDEVIQVLGSMKNETERDALAMQILGKSATELNPLIEDGGKTYKMVADTMKKYDLEYVDQATLDKANEFNDSLDTMKLLGSVALAQVGSSLASTLAPALEKVVNLVGKFASWLGNLDPAILTTIGVIAGVVAAIAPVLLILGKLAFAVSSIMSLMATIGPAIGAFVTGPLLPIVGVIAAVIAAFVLWKKHGDKIKKFFADFGEKIAEVWEKIKEAVTTAVEGVKQVVTTIFNAIKRFILTILTAYVTMVRTQFDLMKAVITTVLNAIKTVVTAVWNAIKTAISTVLTAINTTVTSVWNAIKTTITNVVNAIKTTVTNAWNAIKSTTTTVWNAVKSAITTPINSAKSTLSSLIKTIKGLFDFSGIAGKVKTAFENVRDSITKPIDKAKELVNSAIKTIKNIFPIKLGKIFSGIELPHFKVSGGKLPWGVGGKGVAPSISVEWYAKGGIFNSPSLIGVGEAGSEAVVPLDRFWRTLEGMQTGETNIVINISGAGDPRAVAEEVKRMLIRETNQRRLAWQ